MSTPPDHTPADGRLTPPEFPGLFLSLPPEEVTAAEVAPAAPAPASTKDAGSAAAPAAEVARPIPITSKAKQRPTNVEVFTGQAVAIIDQLFAAREATDTIIVALRKASQQAIELMEATEKEQKEQKEQLRAQFSDVNFAKFGLDLQRATDQARASLVATTSKHLQDLAQVRSAIDQALREYQWNPWQLWLYQWSLVALLVITGIVQAIFIEFYCRWHGSYFISLDLYSPINVGVLAQIGFVGGATTMSVAAEVLTWSSLGVWANQSYVNTMKMLRRTFRFADDGPRYMGVMMRNTSIAATIVILLRLSKFSLFGVSLDPSNPLAFDVTVGISFLLGFFGDDAYRILSTFRDRLTEGAAKKGS